MVYFNHDLSLTPATAGRGYKLSFTATEDFNLSTLSVLAGHADNGGFDEGFESRLTVLLYDVTDGENVWWSSRMNDYEGEMYQQFDDFDLSGVQIESGKTYILRVILSHLSDGNAYASFDGITLNGSLVPAPGTLAILGLAGLTLRRRRR